VRTDTLNPGRPWRLSPRRRRPERVVGGSAGHPPWSRVPANLFHRQSRRLVPFQRRAPAPSGDRARCFFVPDRHRRTGRDAGDPAPASDVVAGLLFRAFKHRFLL